MEISQIRVKYNGKDITKQCEIIIDENLRKFKIITGKDVSDKDELLVIYQTAFKKMITGDIKNIAESYSDDADKVRDDQVVVMEAVQPALMITKKVDKTTYKVGDICEYQLVVTQTIKDAIAKNIVIEDQLSRNGAKVIKNSIKIYAPDGSDITRQCTITAGENKYVIETGKNLSYDELKTTLYNYMKNTLNDFKNQGVVPDMVQVGNETSSGILWDEGKIGGDYTDFTQLAELLNQAISGVRASVGNQTKNSFCIWIMVEIILCTAGGLME